MFVCHQTCEHHEYIVKMNGPVMMQIDTSHPSDSGMKRQLLEVKV